MPIEGLCRQVSQYLHYAGTLCKLINQLLILTLLTRYAPFIYDVWKHPDTLAIVSKIAGVELVTEMDFEIAHINMSTKSEKEKVEELEAFVDKTMTDADEGIAGCPWEDVSNLRTILYSPYIPRGSLDKHTTRRFQEPPAAHTNSAARCYTSNGEAKFRTY